MKQEVTVTIDSERCITCDTLLDESNRCGLEITGSLVMSSGRCRTTVGRNIACHECGILASEDSTLRCGRECYGIVSVS